MPKKTKKPSDIAAEISRISKLNTNVRHGHALSNQGHYINIIDKIIEKSTLPSKDGKVKMFFNAIGIEHDQNSWLEISPFLKDLRKNDCFKYNYTDKEQYIFENVDVQSLITYKENLRKKILPTIADTHFKIIVKDGHIIESESKIAIHKYDTDTKAYMVANYLFNKATPNKWISFDEIIEFCEKTEIDDMDSKQNYKQIIYDAVKNINNHARTKLRHNIIKNNGKTEYKAIK